MTQTHKHPGLGRGEALRRACWIGDAELENWGMEGGGACEKRAFPLALPPSLQPVICFGR